MKHPKVIHVEFNTFGSNRMFPEPPNSSNALKGIGAAKEWHRRQAVDSGHDYVLSDGYGGGPACWTDLYDGDEWDGDSYGEPYARITLGPRSGTIVEGL